MSVWTPTHKITWTPTGALPDVEMVMLDADETGAGPAYTRGEWRADARADWERDESGVWTFQGEATPGGAVGTVEVAALG